MIGRTEEIELLRDQADSDRSRFVVVYGRRRVGKTFLVREAFGYRFTFTHTGVEHVTMSEQLAQFRQSLVVQGYEECPVLTDWIEAFGHLKKLIMRSSDNRKVVFIDELPWMDTPRSGFLTAFEHFWNGWGAHQDNLMLIVCGSATSWISDKLINNKGGLYNSVTNEIKLKPFTLAESENTINPTAL